MKPSHEWMNPPLPPDAQKEVRRFEAREQFEQAIKDEAETTKEAVELLHQPGKSDEKSNPTSGIRTRNPLPKSPLDQLPSGAHIAYDIPMDDEEDRAA